MSAIFSRVPYWLLAIILFGVFFLWHVVTDSDYQVILSAVTKGVVTTLYVACIAYVFSTIVGLVIGLMRISPLRPLRETSSLYTEIVRGVPMLVILYYIAFVGAPALIQAVNWLCQPLISIGFMAELSVRKLNFV